MSALHVAFTKELSTKIRAEAAARGLRPQVLVAGAIAASLDGELLDAIFDGWNPNEAAGGYVRQANGLTHLQCAVLLVLAQGRDATGISRLTVWKIAYLVGGAAQSSTQGALRALERRGLILKAPKVSTVQPWRLTEAGEVVAAELGGRACAS